MSKHRMGPGTQVFPMLVLLIGPLLIGSTQVSGQEAASPNVHLESLRSRVHEMRKDLLLGGKRVRIAESEALDFYTGKVEVLFQQADGIEADLAEKRATYDLALERVLSAPDRASSRMAAEDAERIRQDIASMEDQLAQLARRRQELAQLTGALESRRRDREKLESQLDSSSNISSIMLSLPRIGLAPEVEDTRGGDAFFADQRFMDDLLARDPTRARQVLLSLDPVEYWKRWPLRPPTDVLLKALTFPAPDLPGGR